MPVRFCQIPAVASLRSHLATLMSASPIDRFEDLYPISEVVTRLSANDLTPDALEEFRTLSEDVRAGVWEYGEASGLLSDAQVAKRSSSMEDWYLRQPAGHGDKVGADLRQTWRAIDLAVQQCETLLP